ncbi:MAG TPA: hypothetical protein VD769_08750 [Gaiellaceae bacterium]|nr:hypothetical protein [Gaiellaceae bacterium]
MGSRGVAAMLGAALALALAACSGDDEETTGATTATAPAATQPTSTGAADEPAPATTTGPLAGGETADPALLADAAGTTAAARSARVATSVRVRSPEQGQTRFSGEGAFDFERRRGEMTLELLEGGAGGFGGQSEAIFVDTSVYYRLPPGTLPGGQRWIRLDLQNVVDATGIDFGPLVQGSQADPSQYLLWLSALGPGVTKISEEEVRGVPTTRYRAAVDLGLLEGQAPPGKEAEWSAYVQALRDRLGLDFIPVEVWVDGDGLIRRLYHEHGFGADGTSATVTTELFDFGVAVDAKAPPPGQVAAMNDLIRP